MQIHRHDWFTSQLSLVGRGCQAISKLMSRLELGKCVLPGLGRSWPGLGSVERRESLAWIGHKVAALNLGNNAGIQGRHSRDKVPVVEIKWQP